MEEKKRFQGSTFDTIARKKVVEDQDTILELTCKTQELQNEINCMNNLRVFKMLNQYAVEYPTFPVKLRFHTFPRSWRIPKPFIRNADPQRKAAKHLGHAWYIEKRFFFFANPTVCSSALYPRESNPRI